MTVVLAIPSVLALVILVGMVLKAGAVVTTQLEATQQNTAAIIKLTTRLEAVEKVNVETNVKADEIKDKLTNGEDH